jgi:hypothetical protein
VRSTSVLRPTVVLASVFVAAFEFYRFVFPDWQPGVLPVNESRRMLRVGVEPTTP